MLREIRGLRQSRLRFQVVEQLKSLLKRREVSPVSVRVAFFDDDGPRGGAAIRCALTAAPGRGPVIRVEHTARTYSAAFSGALAILKRQLKRRAGRGRRRTRYPNRRTPAVARRRRERTGPRRGPGEKDETGAYRSPVPALSRL